MRALCPGCASPVLDRVHAASYGLAGSHLVGSERIVCPRCGRTLSDQEARSQGILYIWDTDRNLGTEENTDQPEDDASVRFSLMELD